MDVMAALVIPGVLGGVLLALWLARPSTRPRLLVSDRARRPLPFIDAINMATINVAGIGGLGMVLTAVVIAVFVPGVGVSILAGIGSGALLAAGLILWRRRNGPLTSSGGDRGATTMLGIEAPSAASPRRDDRGPASDRRFVPALAVPHRSRV
jgi:hypothetical protein